MQDKLFKRMMQLLNQEEQASMYIKYNHNENEIETL